MDCLDTNQLIQEIGPSVKDRDAGNTELRANDDSTANEPVDGNCNEDDAQDDETVIPDDVGDEEKEDEVTMDKETAYSDPIGLKPDELDQTSDMDLDLNEDADLMEDVEPNEQDNIAENGKEEKQEEETCSPDEVMEEAHTEVDVNSEMDGEGQQNADMHFTEPKEDIFKPSELINEEVPPAELASQSKFDWQTSGSENVAAESNLSNSHHDSDSTLLGGVPSSISEMDFKMSDSIFHNLFHHSNFILCSSCVE